MSKLIVSDLCHSCTNYSREYGYCSALEEPELEYIFKYQDGVIIGTDKVDTHICGQYEREMENER